MKIKAKVTVLFSHDGMTIEVDDSDAVITFCKIELNQEQTCQVMSRLGNVECKCEVFGLDKVGKQREREMIEFPIGVVGYGIERKKLAALEAKKHCPVGWEPDGYFGSQNSFFEKEGVAWARCSIRRWA